MPTHIDVLETPRLVLRRWTAADRAPFAQLNADSEVMRYFPATLSADETDAFVDRIEAAFAENGFGFWVVESDGRFAGFTGLNRTPFETPIGPHVEIGWRLARWAWGQGFATEAAGAVVEAGFTHFDLDDIYSFTTATNQPSEAVMKRIGMGRRSDLDFDHPNTPDWEGRRHIVYHLSRQAFRETRQRRTPGS